MFKNARFSVLWLAIFSFLHFEDKVLSELLCIYIALQLVYNAMFGR